MYCSNCGKKLSADDFFCSNCGTPVARQGLFEDNSELVDSFEETRLFDPSDLEQYTSDPMDDLQNVHYDKINDSDDIPVNLGKSLAQDKFDIYAQHSLDESYDDTEIPNNSSEKDVVKSINTFWSKIKDRHASTNQMDSISETMSNSEVSEPIVSNDMDEYDNDSGDDEETISLKKLILPIVVIGLVIGLVVGLTITKPWSHDDSADTTTAVIVQPVTLQK